MLRSYCLPVAVMLLLSVVALQVKACPGCNINNYLAQSVFSAKNIYIGKVIKKTGERQAEVEVVKVIRGKKKIGDKIKTELYEPQKKIGHKIIFMDPTSWPPTYKVLANDYENEISFLAEIPVKNGKNNSLFLEMPKVDAEKMIKGPEEAVKCVQGVSVFTQGIGNEYVKTHYAATVDLMIKDAVKLREELLKKGDDVFWGERRYISLVNSILSQNCEKSRTFWNKELKALLAIPVPEVNWNKIPYQPSLKARLLENILASMRSRKYKFYDSTKLILTQRLYTLKLADFSDIAYVLIANDVNLPSDLNMISKVRTYVDLNNLPNNNSRRVVRDKQSDARCDALALAYYYVGELQSGGWQHEAAHKLFKQSFSYAINGNLRKRLLKSIKKSTPRNEEEKIEF